MHQTIFDMHHDQNNPNFDPSGFFYLPLPTREYPICMETLVPIINGNNFLHSLSVSEYLTQLCITADIMCD